MPINENDELPGGRVIVVPALVLPTPLSAPAPGVA